MYLVMLVVLGLALLHLIAGGDDPLALAAEGGGGGYVGYGLSELLVSGFGTPAAVVVLVTLAIVSLMMLMGTSLRDLWITLSRSRQPLPDWRERLGSLFKRRDRALAPQEPLPAPDALPLEAGTPAITPARPRGSLFINIIGGVLAFKALSVKPRR